MVFLEFQNFSSVLEDFQKLEKIPKNLKNFRYDISGKTMPHFRPWFENYLGIDLSHTTPSQKISDMVIEAPVENEDLIDFLKENNISFSNAPRVRLMRGHGHTVHDMVNLRNGKIPRLPDVVVWPKNEQQIVKVGGLKW